MKLSGLLLTIVAFAVVSCGGKNVPQGNAPLEKPRSEDHPRTDRGCVNLNAATAMELTGLPGIGEVTARKIIEYREAHGPFRRPEEIIIIDGFSERKYRAIADRLCVGF